MKRRDFITFLGGAAAAWPLAARGQQGTATRRLGVLMRHAENDPDGRIWLSALEQGLSQLGWANGQNLRTDVRWAAGDVEQMRKLAKELVELRPDILVANSTATTHALKREAGTLPIVFVAISDPVGDGFVAGLPHPAGNLTGFINLEASIGGKWLEMLADIAPGLTRAAFMFNPDTAPGRGSYYLPSFEAAARALKVTPIAARVQSDAEIEKIIASLGGQPGGGLVVMPDNFPVAHRATVISQAAKNKIPAIYWISVFARDGGLLSYGANEVDIMRRSASYVDRILRGAKPGDLPVELPTKYELVINRGTAKTLGLIIPEALLAIADEVIQ